MSTWSVTEIPQKPGISLLVYQRDDGHQEFEWRFDTLEIIKRASMSELARFVDEIYQQDLCDNLRRPSYGDQFDM